jgi:hypothetical protein
MKTALISIALLIAFTMSGLPFGSEGHKAIAEAAADRLTPQTKQKVLTILGGNNLAQAMAKAATWADDIKPGHSLSSTPEAIAFNKVHHDNREWHFVDLPLGATNYSSLMNSRFCPDNDIVHTLNACIAVLEGQNHTQSKRDALRWIIHLTGDIHQPLHVACGYYDYHEGQVPTLVTDPSQAITLESDHGANWLHFAGQELHGYWDSTMVNHIKSAAHQDLAVVIANHLNQASYPTSGDRHKWAAAWATDALPAARRAYQGITFGEASEQGHSWVVKVTLPDQPTPYLETHRALVEQQLAKASYRLAALLNAIHWN